MSASAQGPLRAASVGPNSPMAGAPTAAAICSGPVSPDTINRALRAIDAMSVIVVRGAIVAAPRDAATTDAASGSSLGPHSTIDATPIRSRIAAASAPNRSAGHRLLGHAAPGLTIA